MRQGPDPRNWGLWLVNETQLNAMKDTRCIYVASKHDVFVETVSRIQFTTLLSIFPFDTTSTVYTQYDAVMPL